jgi:pyruvate,water dikinase
LCTRGLEAHDTFGDYAARVVSDTDLRDDTRVREAAVDGLKFLVRHGRVDTTFADALDARAAEIFGDAQIRLRSSTNVEDLPGFSGAGLYESFSAYARGDDRASLEIRKVWASVFEWRAFEERQYWNVDETRVRMGVAVNRAFDDEVANGVLITKNLQDPDAEGLYVNVQQGELAVTNPEQAALPEVFTIVPAQGGDVQVMRERFSSLSPDVPLLAAEEIATLAEAAERTVVTFAPLYNVPPSMLALDLEFKFVGDSRALVIKQARPYAAR